MRYHLLVGAAVAALSLPTAAFAQSTGSVDFDEGEIVITGSADSGVGGVNIPDSPKAKVEIDRELMLRQTPGQTVNDIINLVPGVSFTNNDPFGSLGGNFTIRGFSSDRISQTVDGIPLNDSGNYALYTNQQQDPETLESVNVNLGSTDVDSPTASAVGGTVNIRTRTPRDDLGVLAVASYGNIIARGNPGDRPFHRGFVMIDTGTLTSFGTKAWFSASKATNESVYSNYGGVDKQQYNGKIYQPIGSNGDFIAVSGHYNQNRNNFNGSPYNNVTINNNGGIAPEDRFYEIAYPCTTDTPQAGVADTPNGCGNEFERRFNPSNTGNIRINSRFTLSDGLVLTVDPSFQYVKANGGGLTTGREGGRTVAGRTYYGFSGNAYYFGRDLNGDGDLLDQVRVSSPSQTQTRRYGVIANLSYELDENNRVRLSYTFDRARHRQTGESGVVLSNGEVDDVFPVNNPLLTADGVPLQDRNRLSYATLHRIAGEYRGSFFDDALSIQLAGAMPFFTRDLNQYCFTTSSGGNIDCISNTANYAAYAAANPTFAAPTSRKLDYNKFLPNLGFTYRVAEPVSLFASYAKNLSVPGTDVLYGSLFFDESDPQAKPAAETSDSFDAGVRYQSGIIQAQLTGWFTKYSDRLASAYDPDCDCSVTRNLGEVEKWGFDGSISARPIPELLVYVFGSVLNSEIKENVQTSATGFAQTAGKREGGAPKHTFGARVQGSLGDLDIGFQVKRTGSRFLNDINTVTLPGYTVADIDIRYSLAGAGLERSYFQLNITNLFDESYIGSASSGLTTTSTFVNIGSPRAIVGSLVVGF
jgi:iron complex outermembrane receptor protein